MNRGKDRPTMSLRLWSLPLVLMLLCTAMATGCPEGDGGTTTPPVGAPRILAVQPTGAVAVPGLPVTFRAEATNNPTAWLWTFGPGATPRSSTAAEPTVIFSLAGEFRGTVRAINSNGSSQATTFVIRIVNSLQPPTILGVTPLNAQGESGGTLTFAVTATFAPTQFAWDFGAGATPSTSTDPSPTVTLGALGTYTGTVTVSNSAGSSAAFTFSYEVVPGPEPQVLGVDPQNPIGIEGTRVRLRAITNGGGDSFTWHLNEGAMPVTDPAVFPRITANSVLPLRLRYAGTYAGTVQFTRDGEESEPFPFSYTVAPANDIPAVLGVTHEPMTFRVGEPVQFTAQIANPAAEWSWGFLTGGLQITSQSVIPTVSFPNEGTFFGSVTTLNSRGFSELRFTYTVLEPEEG